MKLAPGYRALRLLRLGDRVAVYDAWSDERGCRCVVKTLRARWADARAARELEAEARLVLSLTHPHLVRGYALLRRPRLQLVLETVPGETLGHLLGRRRITARDVARLGIQLASALRYLHGRGSLHLDLKPSNVICHGGLVKLLDLGLARPPGRGSPGVGTDDYLAPEQARGGMLTPATDVFGLGALLYQAAMGRAPFHSSYGRWQQLDGRAPSVAAARRLPAGLGRAIDACLEPDPSGRPSLEELEAIFAAVVQGPRRASSPRPYRAASSR